MPPVAITQRAKKNRRQGGFLFPQLFSAERFRLEAMPLLILFRIAASGVKCGGVFVQKQNRRIADKMR